MEIFKPANVSLLSERETAETIQHTTQPPLLQNDYNIEIMQRIEFEKVIRHLVRICNSLWDEGLILYPLAVKRLIGRETWTSKHERSNVGVLI